MSSRLSINKAIAAYISVVQVTHRLNLTCCLVTGGYGNVRGGVGKQSLSLTVGHLFLGPATGRAVVEIHWKLYHCKSVCVDRMTSASVCCRSWTLLIFLFVTVPSICTHCKTKTFSVYACNLTVLIRLTRWSKEENSQVCVCLQHMA